MSTPINILQDTGKGRAFTFIIEQGSSELGQVQKVLENFESNSRLLLIEVPKITKSNWNLLSSDVLSKFSELKIRQTSLVGIAATGAITQNLTLRENKLVRSLVLINSSTRSHPNLFSRFIDWIESKLPLGLPLRKKNIDFDSKPFLQRLRSPTLVITSDDASDYIKEQGKLITSRVPTAWLSEVKANEPKQIANLVQEFETVPAKCPQKNK